MGVLNGIVKPGFEAVATEFEANFRHRGDTGAAFSAVVAGEMVVDLWGGWTDEQCRKSWDAETIACIFSGSKGLVATCLLLLLERGLLDLESPVAEYWPEFAAAGKDRILVRHVVSHCAGMPGLLTPVSVIDATNNVRMAQLLAEQPPICPPGIGLNYHALTFGWLSGALIRRIDGRSVGRMFAEDVARPLGLSAWIGLPADQEPRVATLKRGANFGVRTQARPQDETLVWSMFENPPRFSSDPMPANTRSWRAAEIPASNGMATARAMAYLYGCLGAGGEIAGFHLLAADTISHGTVPLCRGYEPVIGREMAYGVGFQLQTPASLFGRPATAFGHDGAGGSMHGAWPDLRTGFSYLTNTLLPSQGADPRSLALLDALHGCVDGAHASGSPHD
ncbi:serine hydrolase domain-containing protein [Mesorhizobium sp. CN2-181]|uniref:serine hydrolase domain-containing protein n=1 Tax=Mesorhizobium yinganensis TaxID=3157707 RepID=UPI0032B7C158